MLIYSRNMHESFSRWIYLYGFLVGFLVTSAGFSFNDYFDVEIDKVNKRLDRPLVSGVIRVRNAYILGVVLDIVGVLFSLLISPTAFLVAVFFAFFVSYGYAAWFKRGGWFLKNVVVGSSYFIPCIYGGFVDPSPSLYDWFSITILGLIAFVFGFGREIMKDAADVEGDASRDVQSLAIIKGLGYALRLSSFLFVFAVFLSVLAYIFVYRSFVFIVTIAPVDFLALYSAYKLPKCKSREEIMRFRSLTIFIFILGLFSFLVSAFF